MAAKRLGENQLDAPIQVEGPEEMRALSQAFDEMRSRLHTAREELIQLNTTLEQRVAQRTRELETLNEVSREISSTARYSTGVEFGHRKGAHFAGRRGGVAMSGGRKPALAETSSVERTHNMRSLATRCAPMMNLPTLCWRVIRRHDLRCGFMPGRMPYVIR